MGPRAAGECDKSNRVGCTLNSMRPSCHRHDAFSAEETRRKAKLSSRSYHFRNNDPDFTEMCFSSPRVSLQNVPSESVGTSYGGELKRGSIYQSSKTVRKMKNRGILEIRPVMLPEFSIQSTSPLPCSGETSQSVLQKRVAHNSSSIHPKATRVSRLNPNANSRGFQDFHDSFANLFLTCNKDVGSLLAKPGSPDSFLEVCFHPDETEHWHSVTERSHGAGRRLGKEETLNRDENSTLKTEMHAQGDKSSLEKPTVANLLSDLDTYESKECPKVQITPLRKMLDPFMSAKSSNSPSLSSTKSSRIRNLNPAITTKNSLLKKSLLKEFSKTDQELSNEPEVHVHSADPGPVLVASPAHLHGCLKMAYKHGAPCFEFTLKDPENIFSAKTHKTDSALNWLYTFHLATGKKKNNGNWGKDGYMESSVVGQMKVSCHLCFRMRNHGSQDAYAITEFVLFDSSCPRKTSGMPEVEISSQSRQYSQQSHEAPGRTAIENMVISSPSDGHENHGRLKSLDGGNNGTSVPSSWMPLDSLAHLQIAAMVVEVPLGKRESLKSKIRDDPICYDRDQNLSSSSTKNHNGDAICDADNATNVSVIIPSGVHGLPASDATGPSPLLDRWRSGGGCDCGGWDMACPVIIFDNHRSHNSIVFPFERNNQHLELFVQGWKEKVPPLTIAVIDKGLYSVNFHAQLSSLQAFAICVAVLHSSEISMPAGKKNIQQRLHSNSLKALLEEDVKSLIGMFTEDGKRKTSKRLDLQTNFMLDPPISPIGRV